MDHPTEMTTTPNQNQKYRDETTEYVPMISYKPDERKDEIDEFDGTDDDEVEEREKWGKKIEYMLSVVGYCVGLGNLWRFPYVCMRNGGGAFLIPFFLSLILCAMPLYFAEVALGQFVSRGLPYVFDICPLFKGIGFSMMLTSLLSSWYYCVILAWVLIFLVNCFKSTLPWTLCGQSWNTPNCYTRNSQGAQGNGSLLDSLGNGTWNGSSLLWSDSIIRNGSDMLINATITSPNATWGSGVPGNGSDAMLTSTVDTKRVVAAEEFWRHNVLEMSDGIENLGGLPWHTTLALFVANLAVLLGVIRGIQSSGKVVYVTATLPYILITVLLIKGATLPGAADGILFYIKPDFSKLLEIETWVEASIQVFYSLGVAWGGIVTMASYNKFNNNCMRDSILLTLVCEGSSVFGGFAIFTFLGHMAHTANIPVANFTSSGPGLAFVVYPEALSYLPLPQLWGVLFFVMLFTLGLDSMFATVETALTALADTWPRFVRRWRTAVSLGFMAALFIGCIPFATRGGVYLFQLVDWYVAAITLFVIGVVENIMVAWIYGVQGFRRDVEMMIGRLPPFYFVIMWTVVSPCLLLLTLVCTLLTYKAPVYGDYVYGPSAIMCGWFIAFFSLVPVPVVAARQLYIARGTFLQRLRQACRPADTWGPAEQKHRESYKLARAGQKNTFPRGPCAL